MLCFYLALFSMLCPLLLSAQDTFLGIRAGVNRSTFGGELAKWFENNGQDFAYRPAFSSGVYLTAQFSEYTAFQSEFLYVRRGTHFTDYNNARFAKGSRVETIYSINYLDIPLLLKGTLRADQYFIPYLYAGPVICIRLGSMRQKTTVTNGDEQMGGEWYDGDKIRTQDFALALGGGVDCDFGPGRLQADLRYTVSLSEIYPVPGIDILNRSMIVTLGYAWKLEI